VATADPDSGLYDEVEGCGLLVKPDDGPAFAAAIARLLDNDPLRRELGVAARERALERWDRVNILATLARMLGNDPGAPGGPKSTDALVRASGNVSGDEANKP
jgi:colanic acid biosynthesis glycosyl transferase WcaI